jgi:putative endonuclease
MNIILYVIEGISTHKRYIGITNDLQRRLQEHRSKYTKGGQVIGDFKLIYTENFINYSHAREREKFLKSGKGRQWIMDNVNKTRSARGG